MIFYYLFNYYPEDNYFYVSAAPVYNDDGYADIYIWEFIAGYSL
jgi:hypothetical protein